MDFFDIGGCLRSPTDLPIGEHQPISFEVGIFEGCLAGYEFVYSIFVVNGVEQSEKRALLDFLRFQELGGGVCKFLFLVLNASQVVKEEKCPDCGDLLRRRLLGDCWHSHAIERPGKKSIAGLLEQHLKRVLHVLRKHLESLAFQKVGRCAEPHKRLSS